MPPQIGERSTSGVGRGASTAWVIAGYIGWNPLDVLDKPTPAARAVNVLLTRLLPSPLS
jgi:hypothetical protein